MNGDKGSRQRLCVGAIGAPHGVRGLVKVQPFTETPEAIVDYAPLTDASGARVFEIVFKTLTKGQWIAAVNGIADRDMAAALRGTKLFVERAALPAPEDDETFYHADLLGLVAFDLAGAVIGAVSAVYDFGAGDLLEIADDKGQTNLVPFTRAAVPDIDLTRRRLIIDPSVAMPEDDPEREDTGS